MSVVATTVPPCPQQVSRPTKEPIISNYAMRVASSKAGRLCCRAGFNKSDAEDIRQELLLDLLKNLPNFDPSKGSEEVFVCRAMRSKAIKLLRDRMASNRTPSRTSGSMNEMIYDKEERRLVELGQTIGEDDPSFEQVDLRLDVESVMAKLPSDLRELCELLKTKSITEAAKALGLGLGSVYWRLDKLRAIFREAGLEPEIARTSSHPARR